MSVPTSYVFTLSSFESSHYAPNRMKVIRKFFNGRETVEIPICRMLLNNCYGGFDLSEQVKSHLRDFDWDNVGSSFRSNKDLHDIVDSIGLEESSGKYASLCYKYVPSNFLNCVEIREYDGLESLRFDPTRGLEDLASCDMSDEEISKKVVELVFMSIVFHLINTIK